MDDSPTRFACLGNCGKKLYPPVRLCGVCSYNGRPSSDTVKRSTLAARAHTARRQERIRNATNGKVERLRVFERDGWICGICHDPVDASLSHPDPMSPSLDHIVPLSKGGDHSECNCQLAHLRCNLSKGTRQASSTL